MVPSIRLAVGAFIGALVLAACSGTREPAYNGPVNSGTPPSSGSHAANPADLTVSTAGWRTDFSRALVDLSQIDAGGPPKDGIPPIDEPKYESIDAAREFWDDRTPVISVELEGIARAYPIAILMWHEIVNDTLGGRPLVVTFCPLCNTALVFDRQLGGVVYDFGTTGNLRFSDLVMYDRQTETWWQQATGQAIVGELTGAALTFLPAQIVALGDFARDHPTGDVLSRDTGFRRDYGRNPYLGYDSVDRDPFLFFGETDGRLPPKERVVTVAGEGQPVAFPYTELQKVGAANSSAGGEAVVVFWMPGTASALDAGTIDQGRDIGATGVFRPVVDGRPLTFVRQGEAGAPIRDRETGSSWSVTGVALDGALKGAQLEPVVHGDHFWFAWAAFSPETTIWTAE